jgi:hypothetical protein
MIPFRVVRSGVLLAGLLTALNLSVRAADGGFTSTLSSEERTAAGITLLTAGEIATLDRLVAEDYDRVRLFNSVTSQFTERQTGTQLKQAGLDRLAPEQLAKLNETVATVLAARPQPRERPRLKDGAVLSEQGRLRVHGGMSFTYGWAGGGRSYRETSAWVSYFDPVTGIGLGFGFSNFSGDSLYPGYYYDRGYYPTTSTPVVVAPRAQLSDGARLKVNQGGFNGDGASMRGSSRGGHGMRGQNRL